MLLIRSGIIMWPGLTNIQKWGFVYHSSIHKTQSTGKTRNILGEYNAFTSTCTEQWANSTPINTISSYVERWANATLIITMLSYVERWANSTLINTILSYVDKWANSTLINTILSYVARWANSTPINTILSCAYNENMRRRTSRQLTGQTLVMFFFSL